ncbi:MAG: ester cyclase [Planctomycetota bacterium]|jgi:predicted ester cyclase
MSAVDVVKAGIAAQEAGDFDKAAELLTDDMVFAGPVPQPVGKREYLGLQSALKAAMPDWKFNASDFKESGDQVTAVMTVTGTHTAELKLPLPGMPTVPATGKKVALPKQTGTFTVKGDKVSRIDIAVEAGGGVQGILAQLGVSMPG